MSTSAPHFFVSYSREDSALQRHILTELRGRGIQAWVDVENLIPGSPTWEKEIERSIRAAAGMIVLLSPASCNSEWVRREISFAEQNQKRIFPVLIHGEEEDAIPLRLSSHQRVDLRRNFQEGLDELANALRDHLGTTLVIKRKKPAAHEPPAAAGVDLKQFLVPGLIALIGVACIAGLAIAARFAYTVFTRLPPTQIAFQTATPSDVPPIQATSGQIITTGEELTGKIVYTCQVDRRNTSDQICLMQADGSNARQLTQSHDNQDASFSPDGQTIIFVSDRSGNYEIYEMDLSGNVTQLTDFKDRLSLPAISPDDRTIAFTRRVEGEDQIWLMDRSGAHARLLYQSNREMAVAPTWSPDGTEILFAEGKDLARQLFIIPAGGGEPRLLHDQIVTPGRTDWSRQGVIAFFMGDGWTREVWTILPNGSEMIQVTHGKNSQGPSFSPGGRYITYTAYTGVAQQDEFSCEIFIMDLDTGEEHQVTNNDICDYQPRWGE